MSSTVYVAASAAAPLLPSGGCCFVGGTDDEPKTYPCVVCGTTGGYVPKAQTIPMRTRGACSACYARYRYQGRLEELDRDIPHRPGIRTFLDRLLAGEVEPDDSGCIIWPGATSGDGYARVSIGGDGHIVTRLVLETFVGPPPSSDHVAAHDLHEVCGNTDCVNVDHLRWATPAENSADMIPDGTSTRGERNAASKLTSQEVLEIRELAADGELHRNIAALYGVSKSHVSNIVTRRKWAHLPEDAEGEATSSGRAAAPTAAVRKTWAARGRSGPQAPTSPGRRAQTVPAPDHR